MMRYYRESAADSKRKVRINDFAEAVEGKEGLIGDIAICSQVFEELSRQFIAEKVGDEAVQIADFPLAKSMEFAAALDHSLNIFRLYRQELSEFCSFRNSHIHKLIKDTAKKTRIDRLRSFLEKNAKRFHPQSRSRLPYLRKNASDARIIKAFTVFFMAVFYHRRQITHTLEHIKETKANGADTRHFKNLYFSDSRHWIHVEENGNILVALPDGKLVIRAIHHDYFRL